MTSNIFCIKLDDVSLYGVTNIYKDYLHLLTSKEGRIWDKLFSYKDKEAVAYDNASKRLSFNVIHLLCFFRDNWLSNCIQTNLKIIILRICLKK